MARFGRECVLFPSCGDSLLVAVVASFRGFFLDLSAIWGRCWAIHRKITALARLRRPSPALPGRRRRKCTPTRLGAIMGNPPPEQKRKCDTCIIGAISATRASLGDVSLGLRKSILMGVWGDFFLEMPACVDRVMWMELVSAISTIVRFEDGADGDAI